MKGTTTASLDSLENLLNSELTDSFRVSILHRLCMANEFKNPEKAAEYLSRAMEVNDYSNWEKLEKGKRENLALSYLYRGYLDDDVGDYTDAYSNFLISLDISESIPDSLGISKALNNLGIICRKRGSNSLALEHYQRSLIIAESMQNYKGMASCYNNIGNVHRFIGNYNEALKSFFKSLQLRGETGNEEGIGICYTNIGIVYGALRNKDKALEYYKKALVILEGVGKQQNIAITMNNIGNLLQALGDKEEAIDYHFKALEIQQKLGNQERIATSYNNIGNFYFAAENFDQSLNYYQKSLRIKEELGIVTAIPQSLTNIGLVYIEKNKLGKTLEYLQRSLEISEDLGSLFLAKQTYNVFTKAYVKLAKQATSRSERKENFKQAWQYLVLFNNTNDSLVNENKSKELGRLEGRFEFEREITRNTRLELEREVRMIVERQRRDNLQYSGIAIFMALLFGGMAAARRLTVPVRIVEGIVFFSFLLFFEFTLVLLDPFIEEYSAGAPAGKLAFNAVLAALIFPLHSYFESSLKKRLSN